MNTTEIKTAKALVKAFNDEQNYEHDDRLSFKAIDEYVNAVTGEKASNDEIDASNYVIMTRYFVCDAADDLEVMNLAEVKNACEEFKDSYEASSD